VSVLMGLVGDRTRGDCDIRSRTACLAWSMDLLDARSTADYKSVVVQQAEDDSAASRSCDMLRQCLLFWMRRASGSVR